MIIHQAGFTVNGDILRNDRNFFVINLVSSSPLISRHLDVYYNVRHIKTYCGQFALFILSFKNIMDKNVLLSSQILTNHSSRAKNGTSGLARHTQDNDHN